MNNNNKVGRTGTSPQKRPQIASNSVPNKIELKRGLETGKIDPVNLMISIIRQQKSLYKKEIDDWIAARMEAQNTLAPNRYRLYLLYDDIILDAVIHGQVYNQRILKISNKKLKLVDTSGEKDDDKTKLLKKQWVDKFIKLSMESIFYGHSLIYVSELKGTEIKKVKLVYREHVRPEHHLILKTPFDTKGEDYTQPPYNNYCIAVGEDEDLGLLNKAAPLFILKKHSWANWDQFEEMFGMPIRWAKTASQDKRVQAEIESWLKEMGSASYAMFPQDTEFEIKESTRPDAFGVFNEKRKAANEELSILFNGQTMTMTNGSSKAQGEVHERSQEEITYDDAKFILSLINDELLPLLIRMGYPFKPGDAVEWDESVELTIDEKVKVYTAIDSMGFDIDQQEVENAFGVKINGRKQLPAAEPPPSKDKEEKGAKK